jgi:uncharacterized BrkB/YihY/UPF0761 family membrane protein
MDMTANDDDDFRQQGARANGRRPLAGLFSDLWRETTTLVHDEVELAKADISDKVAQAGRGVSAVAAGGAVLFAGFIVLLFAAVGALEMVLPPEQAPWLAPLIVGAVVTIIGAVALSSGKKKLQAENLKPTRSIDSLRRDRDVAKEHLQSKEHLQ